MRKGRIVASVAVCALLLTACGARLTEEQRELAISGAASGSTTGQSAGTGTASGTGGGAGAGGGTDGGDGAVAAPSGGSAGSAGGTGGSGSGSGGDGGGSGGSGGEGGGGDGGSGGGESAEAAGGGAWQQVPDGGNGGATDVGVTEESITIANVSDISGAVPGIFEDAQLAAAAYAAYHNATQGPIYGRTLDFLPLDSRMDSNGNRQQYLRACDEAFAAVGSMTAFEEGAVEPVKSCGIPDLRNTTTSQPMLSVDNAYSTLTQSDDQVVSAEYMYWKEQAPEAIKNSGYLVLDNQTTRYQTKKNRDGSKQIGYEWDYVEFVQVAETNYSGFVLDMQEQGVEFVTIQGDYTNAVRLADAMAQQDFEPEIFALQTNAYTPNLIASGGQAVEGAQVAIATKPLAEMGESEEMQLYAEWLKQVDPSAEPSSLGMVSWSAMKLFVEGLKEIGPEVTRGKILDFLSGVSGWTGNGLHGPQDIGAKELTSCIVIVEVSGGEFVRRHPNEGFRCEEPFELS